MSSSVVDACVFLLRWILAHKRYCDGGEMHYGDVYSPVTRRYAMSYGKVGLLFQSSWRGLSSLRGTLGRMYPPVDFQFCAIGSMAVEFAPSGCFPIRASWRSRVGTVGVFCSSDGYRPICAAALCEKYRMGMLMLYLRVDM